MNAQPSSLLFPCLFSESMGAGLVVKDAFRWNTVLRGLLEANSPQKAILGFIYMRSRGTSVDSYTILFLTKAFGFLPPLVSPPERVHCHILKLGFESNIIIRTSLLRIYALFGSPHSAFQVFDEAPQRDVIHWNALIAAYEQMGQHCKAAQAACAMINENVRPNEVTMVSIISSCSQIKALAQGRSAHGYSIKNLVGLDAFVHNALISMYCRCKCLGAAHRLFEMMTCKNEVSWATMIGGYTVNNCLNEALNLFKRMEGENVMSDDVTVLSLVSMCTKLGSLELGQWIDGYVRKNRVHGSICVANALIDMHSKCGNINKSCEIFGQMTERSVVSWTAMIQGLALHGHGVAALSRFSQMQREGFRPDEILFLSILNACSYGGMVTEGRQCFKSMVGEYGLIPWIEHYGIMVDLLCRAGLLNEAFEFVAGMPMKPDTVIWRTMIRASEEEGNIGVARKLIELVVKMEPKNSENYVMKSHLHAIIGEWDDVEGARHYMGSRGITKKHPGWSWIEVKHSE